MFNKDALLLRLFEYTTIILYIILTIFWVFCTFNFILVFYPNTLYFTLRLFCYSAIL